MIPHECPVSDFFMTPSRFHPYRTPLVPPPRRRSAAGIHFRHVTAIRIGISDCTVNLSQRQYRRVHELPTRNDLPPVDIPSQSWIAFGADVASSFRTMPVESYGIHSNALTFLFPRCSVFVTFR